MDDERNIFIKRYIRNCIVFDIPCKTALNTLKTFVTKMEKFNEENDILKKESDNQWLSSLQKACKEFYYSFLNNAVIANISSDNFDKEFEELFQQAQNGNVILENKYSKENNINTQDKESKKENSINNVNNEEKSTNSLKENNNDIQEKDQKAKPQEQLSKKLVETDANNTNNKDKNESNIKADHPQDTNNILLQNKNIQTTTSNNNISESKFGIKPEIEITNPVGDKNNDYKQSAINNKNSNEIKPQNNNSNKSPTFEDENENHSTNNNQGSKWSLCQGCSCNIWPFN